MDKFRIKEKQAEHPDFIFKEKDGRTILVVKIPKKLEKELTKEVKTVSGAILCM